MSQLRTHYATDIGSPSRRGDMPSKNKLALTRRRWCQVGRRKEYSANRACRAIKDVSAREHGRVFQAETDGFAQFFKRFGLERASFLKRFHVCPASVPC